MKNEKLAEQLRLAAEIIETGHPFEFSEDHFHWFKTNNEPIHHIKRDDEIRLTLATPGDGRPLHNPDNLTAEQVGAGWRLIIAGEETINPMQVWRAGILEWEPIWDGYMGQPAAINHGQLVTIRIPLSTPWPKAPKPEPYAELKAAHKAGKVIQYRSKPEFKGLPIDWEDMTLPPSFCMDGYDFRIKPEPAFTLPPPPPGMRWHREDGWKEGDLPQGWRPLVLGERVSLDDEWKNWDNQTWQKRTQIFGEESDGANNRIHAQHRTKRPLTFTHEGKEWTWFRAGDPCPVDPQRSVFVLFLNGQSLDVSQAAEDWSWGNYSAEDTIIGWRYAEPVMVELGPDDVLPGSVISAAKGVWFSINWVGIYSLCYWEPVKLTGESYRIISFQKLQYEHWQINRSLPKTGKWDESAWEKCEKESV